MKTNKKLTLLTAGFVSALALMAVSSLPASAAGLAGTLTMAASCNSRYNGVGTSTVNVPTGTNINVTVNNEDGVVAQNVSGPGISSQLQSNNKSSTHVNETFQLGNITSPVILTFTPVPSSDSGVVSTNYCPLGSSPVSSQLVVNPVAAPAAAPSSSSSTPKTTAPAASTPAASTPPTTTDPIAYPDLHTNMPILTHAVDTKSDRKPLWIGLGVLVLLAVGGFFAYRRGMLNKVLPRKFQKKLGRRRK